MGEDVDELCFGFFLRCIFEVWLYLMGTALSVRLPTIVMQSETRPGQIARFY